MQIDIAHTVAVGQHERLVTDVLLNPLDAAARLSIEPRINERHLPRFRDIVVHRHAVALCEVKGDIRSVQVVVGKILLDHIALVAETDHKFMKPIIRIDLHDVPENRLATDLDHGLRPQR